MQQGGYFAPPVSPALASVDHMEVLRRRVRTRSIIGSLLLLVGGAALGAALFGGIFIALLQSTGVETTGEVVSVADVDCRGGWCTTDFDARFTTGSGGEITTDFSLDGRYRVGDTFTLVYLPAAPADFADSPDELGYYWLGFAMAAAVGVPFTAVGLFLVVAPRRKARRIRKVIEGGGRTPARLWPMGPSAIRLEPLDTPGSPLAVQLLGPLLYLPSTPVDVVVMAAPQHGTLVVVQLPDGRLLLPKAPAIVLAPVPVARDLQTTVTTG
jgi:uncharacterized protein DUF3592